MTSPVIAEGKMQQLFFVALRGEPYLPFWEKQPGVFA